LRAILCVGLVEMLGDRKLAASFSSVRVAAVRKLRSTFRQDRRSDHGSSRIRKIGILQEPIGAKAKCLFDPVE
jgi:hypothetical protein